MPSDKEAGGSDELPPLKERQVSSPEEIRSLEEEIESILEEESFRRMKKPQPPAIRKDDTPEKRRTTKPRPPRKAAITPASAPGSPSAEVNGIPKNTPPEPHEMISSSPVQVIPAVRAVPRPPVEARIEAGSPDGGKEPPPQIPPARPALEDRAGVGAGKKGASGNNTSSAPGPPAEKGLVNGKGMDNSRPHANGTLVKGPGFMAEKGLVNGNGLVNGRGVENGHGRTNEPQLKGRGFVNKKGLVNGNGLVNGRGDTDTFVRPPFKKRAVAKTRGRLIAVVASVAVLLLLVSVFAFSRFPHSERLAVDGDFSDWNGHAFYSDERSTGLPAELDLVSYSMAAQDGRMLFCIRTAGTILSGKTAGDGVDTVNMLVDSDGNPATGYRIGGLGADRRIEVFGWDGIVRGSGIYSFSPGRGPENWNGWAVSGSAEAAASGRSLEASAAAASLGIFKGADYRVLFRVQDRNGLGDTGKALVGPSTGALVITQQSAVPPVLSGGVSSAPVLLLGLSAQIRDVEVRSVTLTRMGDAGSSDCGPVSINLHGSRIASGSFRAGSDRLTLDFNLGLKRGDSAEFEICVDIPQNATPGASFGLTVGGAGDIDAMTGAVTLLGRAPSLCYLVSSPDRIKIDGAFADWGRVALHNDLSGDGAGPGTDISAYQGVKDNGTVAFYASVDGAMMGGVLFPGTVERPSRSPPGPSGHGPGPVVSLPVLCGCDTVEAFIDSDHDYLTGANVGPALFGADFALVVTGIDGRIISREVLAWHAGKGWERVEALEAACDGTRLELAAPLALLGLEMSSSFGAYIVASDWKGARDLSDARMDLVDPLELKNDGTVWSSSDGNSWTKYNKAVGTTSADMCTNHNNGYSYVLTDGGDVYYSTGNWSSWTRLVTSSVSNTFIAIDTDSNSGSTPYLYALTADGKTYYTNTTTASWTQGGNVSANSDHVDLCYASGNGTSSTLYAIRSSTASKAFKSGSDLTKDWSTFGSSNVGNDGNSEMNAGMIYVSSVWSNKYLFILQNDSDIRYDTDSDGAGSWTRLAGPASSGYVDLDWDATNSKIWIADDSGNAYTYTPKSGGSAGEGNWSNQVSGPTGGNHVVAIALNEVPEFPELLLPLLGMVAFYRKCRSQLRIRPLGEIKLQ